ncbi:RraA family protein [Microvirga brassicacearum]|uniref:Putative 4-hydroxy-4-methyl-2-oxoglutarate aldolase n=1 Tax=Microvirga brassicacearum TaxID=2580413 RepID=A0A5N3PAQ9_9HYPH|nr:RraA family protein [Microvirga brassicacearum]KAB0266783.1 RraA family protein [Microvirga brassicacearum]
MLGLQVLNRKRLVDTNLIARFRSLPVANVSDVMARMTAGGSRLRPMHDGSLLIGPAITVKTRPGDNLFVHKALDMVQPGDVVVVDAGGDLTNSIIGEMMLAYAATKKLGGIVINGAVRDVGSIRRGSFPVFAAGVTHRGPYKDGPGEINVPIAIDGMVVEPGDLMLGDDDGLLCVPIASAAAIYEKAAAKHAAEEAQIVAIAEGRYDRAWVDLALQRIGCPLES